MNALRRGACPSIADPMATGDGLLARLMLLDPIPPDAFAHLCDASQEYGNGIVEVTQRGSLQFRGLKPRSAAAFARRISALGLAQSAGPPLLTPPLLGFRVPVGREMQSLVAAMRSAISRDEYGTALSPKVSLLVDGDDALHLDDVPADVRLRASGGSRLHLSIGGTAGTAVSIGWVEREHAVKVTSDLLGNICARGPAARARDFANDRDVAALRALHAGSLVGAPPPPPRARAEPVGTHALHDGQLACGVALAFGHAEATALKRFANLVRQYGASSIRPAPGRALLAFGLTLAMAENFTEAVGAQGFIVRPNDVRRYVVACAGAPACGSATLATRQLAPAIAAAAGTFLDASSHIHLSGCAKGCANPGVAALTLVGPDRLIVRGRASDPPHGKISTAALLAGLSRLQSNLPRKLDPRDVVKSLGGQAEA